MSNFTLEDTEDFDIEIDLSPLNAGRKSREKREPRSLQELKVHYLNFCANRDLDSETPPEEQISYCEKDQRWLDAHVAEIRLAQRQKRLYARGKTQQLRNMLIAIKQKTGDVAAEHHTETPKKTNMAQKPIVVTLENEQRSAPLKASTQAQKRKVPDNQLSLF